MNTTEIKQRLKDREQLSLTPNQIEDLCFMAMETEKSPIEQIRAAVILSGIIRKGLGQRTKVFLEQHPDLPPRAQEILNNSLLRMAGF